ncbi:MAG: anaerobic ribonucleoside-triphosphate reductase activating protein [Acetatifactor muris]|nr:anaerobic ribonucleoside-triphosphate reductase activating protein [Acetatifactor muris]MCM1526604.1 anaerobic ribonucleoside-triphosphate reductase activating protein [Bacteroides sp.]
MRIYGFQKTTLLDYPEHVAATIFTGGCNFRCPFCQNAGLVLPRKNATSGAEVPDAGLRDAEVLDAGFEGDIIPEAQVWAHLQKRRNVLDGVCITGGEPTLQPDLEDFIIRVRELGYKVKLDTNGYRPEVLRHLLEQGLLDYVAMDVKASEDHYARAVGLEQCNDPGDAAGSGALESGVDGLGVFQWEKIRESIGILRECGIPYEFRTTAVKGLHTVEEFDRIGRLLAGSRAYFIQNYKDSGQILKGDGLSGFGTDELMEMKRLAGQYIDRVELRGVDS